MTIGQIIGTIKIMCLNNTLSCCILQSLTKSIVVDGNCFTLTICKICDIAITIISYMNSVWSLRDSIQITIVIVSENRYDSLRISNTRNLSICVIFITCYQINRCISFIHITCSTCHQEPSCIIVIFYDLTIWQL